MRAASPSLRRPVGAGPAVGMMAMGQTAGAVQQARSSARGGSFQSRAAVQRHCPPPAPAGRLAELRRAAQQGIRPAPRSAAPPPAGAGKSHQGVAAGVCSSSFNPQQQLERRKGDAARQRRGDFSSHHSTGSAAPPVSQECQTDRQHLQHGVRYCRWRHDDQRALARDRCDAWCRSSPVSGRRRKSLRHGRRSGRDRRRGCSARPKISLPSPKGDSKRVRPA